MIDLRADRTYPHPVDVPVDAGQQVLVAAEGDEVVGVVVWRVDGGLATVSLVGSAPGPDHDVALLDALRAHARERGLTKLVVEVADTQTALSNLLQDATLLSTFMVRPTPSEPPALPPGFEARDMTADEYATWKQLSIEGYAEANLARSGGDRALALRRSHESFDRFLPEGAATADTRLLTLTLDGAAVGDLWIRHHWPRYRDPEPGTDQTFTFDVAVHESARGRGLGRAAMIAVARAALEVGDRQLGLNVFGDNDVATGLYRSLGYTARTSVLDVALGSDEAPTSGR